MIYDDSQALTVTTSFHSIHLSTVVAKMVRTPDRSENIELFLFLKHLIS